MPSTMTTPVSTPSRGRPTYKSHSTLPPMSSTMTTPSTEQSTHRYGTKGRNTYSQTCKSCDTDFGIPGERLRYHCPWCHVLNPKY